MSTTVAAGGVDTDVAALQALCAALARRDRSVRLLRCRCDGETDLHLHARAAEPTGGQVELLASSADAPARRGWQAVRIDAGSRAVRSGRHGDRWGRGPRVGGGGTKAEVR